MPIADNWSDQRKRIDDLSREHQYCTCTGHSPCTVYVAAILAARVMDADDYTGMVSDRVCLAHPPSGRCFDCATDGELAASVTPAVRDFHERGEAAPRSQDGDTHAQ